MTKGSISEGVVYHAGFPNAAEDQRFDALSLDQLVFRHRASTYLWRLEGDGIPELSWPGGAIVVVDRALTPRDGNLVVAVVDEEFVVRRWLHERLLTPDGRPDKGQQRSLWGVITHTLHEHRSL